jgi:hypothetical protein
MLYCQYYFAAFAMCVGFCILCGVDVSCPTSFALSINFTLIHRETSIYIRQNKLQYTRAKKTQVQTDKDLKRRLSIGGQLGAGKPGQGWGSGGGGGGGWDPRDRGIYGEEAWGSNSGVKSNTTTPVKYVLLASSF